MKKSIMILNVFLIISAAGILLGCSQNAEPYPTPVVNYPADANVVFFPEKEPNNDYKYKGFTALMTAFQEPSLYQLKDENKSVYRVTIAPARTRQPFMVRVEINPEQNSGSLVFKQTKTINDLSAVELYDPKITSLNSDQIEALQKMLDEKKFWTIPTTGGSEGLDGAQYIIEGYADGEYHLVVRWSPEYDVQDGVFDIASSFMKLADIYLKNYSK